MTRKLLIPLAISAVLWGQGCRPPASRPDPTDFVAQVSRLSPSGWRVTTTNDVLIVRRDAPVWIMGYISRPVEFGAKEDFFRRYGQEIHYELRLRFVPLLNRADYKSLRAARMQAAARLKQGAAGKSEYGELAKQYERCQIPLYFTPHYSVFVERWADLSPDTNYKYRIEPLFVEVYPPEAASEIDVVVRSFGQVFKQYGDLDVHEVFGR